MLRFTPGMLGGVNANSSTAEVSMNCKKLFLTAFCAAAITPPHGWSQPPANEDKRRDVMKNKVVERRTSQVVQNSAELERLQAALQAQKAEAKNPTVEPGKVKWHKTLADAQAASEKSGKPVLLFHMMGQLDKQFC
jgi:hypothetical protein